MSGDKRAKEAHDDLVIAINEIAAEIDDDGDDSNEAVDKRVYAAAFAGWRDGKLTGTAQDIFDAATSCLDPTYRVD